MAGGRTGAVLSGARVGDGADGTGIRGSQPSRFCLREEFSTARSAGDFILQDSRTVLRSTADTSIIRLTRPTFARGDRDSTTQPVPLTHTAFIRERALNVELSTPGQPWRVEAPVAEVSTVEKASTVVKVVEVSTEAEVLAVEATAVKLNNLRGAHDAPLFFVPKRLPPDFSAILFVRTLPAEIAITKIP
jgi:hypothetical protein